MKSRLLLFCLVVLLVQGPVLADEILVDGRSFSSWTEYFQSDYFQEAGKRCGTPQNLDKPEIFKPPSDCTMQVTNPVEEYDPGVLWEIPVVVHILMSAAGDGVISDELVHSQIDVLNEDFRAITGTPGEPGTDITIQFRLATEDPQGQPSTGITRTTNEFWFQDFGDPVFGDYWDELSWDPNLYCNIYTNAAGGGGLILGYVPFLPQQGAGSPEDRIVILWSAFGRPGQGGPPYDQGRTVTHEMGHYVGLFHTFDSGCGTTNPPGCYTTGDHVCDTEPESSSRGGCPFGAVSCGTLDPIHNYMDYTNDTCMNNFTPEQANRGRCSVQHYRSNLYTEIPVDVNAPRAGVALHQNRPNPFNPQTVLSFEIASRGQASLQILDVGGRLVKTVVTGVLDRGPHRFTWDGTDADNGRVSSGVYLYRLTTADGSQTRRMVLLK